MTWLYISSRVIFCLSIHQNSINVDNNKIISTHHFVVRVDDRRSRRSVGEHSEKGDNDYVTYHLHDGAHLSSFPKKITNTICNTHERSIFSTIKGKFYANSHDKPHYIVFLLGLCTVIDYRWAL